jgi:DNA polymerase III sliding clamp (beta) subunit (PCNA family)
MIKRTELIENLELVEPALGSNIIVPAFKNLYFHDGIVRAFNGQFRIQTPCNFEFEGGLPGVELLAMLRRSRAKTVVVEVKEDQSEVTLKLGGSRIRLPAAAELFSDEVGMPDLSKKKSGKIFLSPEVLQGLVQSLVVAVDDSSLGEKSGLAVGCDEDGKLLICSTDGASIFLFSGESSVKKGMRIGLSVRTCDQIVKLAKKNKAESFLHMASTGIKAEFNQCILYGSIRELKSDYFKKMNSLISGYKENKLSKEIPITALFVRALDRAQVLVAGDHSVMTNISVDVSRMVLMTKSPLGEVVDRIKIDSKFRLTSSYQFKVDLVQRILPYAKTIQFCKDCLIFRGPSFQYLVSVHSGGSA